jgi:hypothetical protein
MKSKFQAISVMLKMCDLEPNGTCKECQQPDNLCNCLAGSVRTLMAMAQELPFFPLDDDTCLQMFIRHYNLSKDFVQDFAQFITEWHASHGLSDPSKSNPMAN